MITIKRSFRPGRGLIRPEELSGYVFSPEAAAHMFIITKMEKVDGQEAAVPFDAGTDISCRFIKANGVTELVDGDLTDDGAASITLPAECYQVPGRFILSIYAETSEETICIYSATATALAGDTEEINVSGNTKRTIDAQIAALNDAVENAQETVEQVQEVIDSIPQDYTALSNSVSDLKSHLEHDTKLLYAKQLTPTFIPGGINNNNGGNVDSNQYIRTQSHLRAANGLQITVAEGYKARVAMYTSQGGVQGFIGWLDTEEWNGTHYYPGPDSYSYRVRLRKDPIGDIVPSDSSNVSITVYRTDETLTVPLAPADGKVVGEKIKALESVTYGSPYGAQPYQMSLFKPTTNLFAEKFSYYRIHRYYDSGTDGKLLIKATQSYNGWLIRVKPGATYTLGPVDFRIKIFSANLDLLETITTTNLSNSEPNTITIPDNGFWLALTQSDDRDMSEWMMVEGETYPEEYVSGYPQWVAEPSSVSGTTKGKVIAFMGDSITAGVATSKTYHEYLHDRYGLKCLNYGYGGAGYYKNNPSYGSGRLGTGNEGIGVAITSENYLEHNNVVSRLAELSSLTKLDGIVIFAGTNDFGNDVSIENYITGIESAFTYCQTNYPTVPVLVLTPIHRKGDTEANDVGKTLSEYVDVLIDECRKFGIAYIDTMTMTGIHPDNDNNRTTFFSTDSNTGLHPGPAGHKRIASVVGETLKQVISCNDF